LVTNTFKSDEQRVCIAGTGNMARALGALMAGRGVEVRAVGGRSVESAEDARRFMGAGRAVGMRDLPQYARRIVIAVTDAAIAEVAAELAAGGCEGGIILHTSGAAGPAALEVLRRTGNSVGVLHPLQTVPSAECGVESLPGSTFALAGDAAAAEWAIELTKTLGGMPLRVNPAYWHHYHAGAVMACNYQITLADAALELMAMAGIERNDALAALGPILRATTANVIGRGPEQALTGPIRRGDAGTIRRHLDALGQASAQTKRLYVAAGLRTVGIAERAGLNAAAARDVAAALEAGIE
jgi:predicted short-subunit dehydrogenase-like oxidoreductase (DUF2520 family)